MKAGKVLMKIKEHFSDKEFSLNDIKQLISTELEIDPNLEKFQNCHGSEFTLDQLINFFVSKGKLEQNNGNLKVVKDFKCGCSH